VAAVVAASAAPAQENLALAVLPFENVSGHIEAQRLIMPRVEAAVASLGYRMVGPADVEPFLARHRIRNTGQLTRGQLDALRREVGANLALVGSVAIFNDSPENPQWGLTSRLLATSTGAITWTGTAGLTGDEFTGALGLGKVTSHEVLGERTVAELLQDFPRAGQSRALAPTARRLLPRVFASRAAYRSPTLDTAAPRRVAVLPFENLSERKGAARIVTDVFTSAVVRQGRFEVVEPGTVMEALVAVGILPYGAIDLGTLGALRERLPADAIILGTVFRYSEGLRPGATTSPQMVLDARMLDLATGRILWMAERGRDGGDSQVLLHFGTIRAMVPLVLKAAGDMLETL
jgi:TolB-like protein